MSKTIKKGDRRLTPAQIAEKREKARARRWLRTGVSPRTVEWMQKEGWL